jgi:hypothetical protein
VPDSAREDFKPEAGINEYKTPDSNVTEAPVDQYTVEDVSKTEQYSAPESTTEKPAGANSTEAPVEEYKAPESTTEKPVEAPVEEYTTPAINATETGEYKTPEKLVENQPEVNTEKPAEQYNTPAAISPAEQYN